MCTPAPWSRQGPGDYYKLPALSQPSKEGLFHTAFGKTGAHEWTTIALFQSDSSYGETENVKHDHDEQENF